MDFHHDLGEISRKHLKKFGITMPEDCSDWNIYHLHLEKKTRKGFQNPKLLFFQVRENTAYFIDVRQHPVGNEWFSRKLLNIVYDNWPELISYHRGITPVLEYGVE